MQEITNTALKTKLTLANIMTPDKTTQTVSAIWMTVPEDAKGSLTLDATGADWDAVQNLVLEYSDNVLGKGGSKDEGKLVAGKSGGSSKSKDIIPSATTEAKAADYVNDMFTQQMNNANNAKILDICVSKPTPAKRFSGITTFAVTPSSKTLETWKSYANDPNVEIQNTEEYNALVELLEKAVKGETVNVDIYINDTKPAVAGYKYQIGSEPEEYVKGDRASLAVLLSTKFAGAIPTNEDNGLGAKLRMADPNKSTKNRGKVSAQVKGKSAYFGEKDYDSKGIITYEEEAGKTVKQNVRSAKSFTIKKKTGTDDNGRPVWKKVTVRLSGQVDVPQLKRKEAFVSVFGPISNRVIGDQTVAKVTLENKNEFMAQFARLLEEAQSDSAFAGIKSAVVSTSENGTTDGTADI